ncbi:MAG: hypothetical protein PHQ28_00935 [Mycobacterium sp.]|nr:hypothetical protein [Mycobacterium sp.]
MSDDELQEVDPDWDGPDPEPDSFTTAWKRGIELVGRQYFREGGYFISYELSPPDIVEITRSLEFLPAGTAVFLAAMVSFYNGDTGGKMLRGLQAAGLGDIAARLDHDQRTVLADLLVAYTGW